MRRTRYKNLVYALAAVVLAATVVMSYSQTEPTASPATGTHACSGDSCAACPKAATCPSTAATGSLTVARARCNGCTRCAVVAPHTFAMDKEGKAIVVNPQGDSAAAIANAIQGCRKGAISRR